MSWSANLEKEKGEMPATDALDFFDHATNGWNVRLSKLTRSVDLRAASDDQTEKKEKL
jgi:hypothetical protein